MKTTDTKRALRAAFYENNRGNLFLAMLFGILLAAYNPYISKVLGDVIDAVSTGNWPALRRTGITMLILIPMLFFANIALSVSKAHFIHKGLRQYKERAFAVLSRKSIAAFTSENTGTYLSTLTNDAASVEANYLNNMVLLVYNTVMFCMALAMMLWYSPLLTLIVVALSALPIVISVLMGKGLARRERAVSDENEAFTTRLKDLLGGFAVIKSFKAEERTADIFRAENDALEQTKKKRRVYAGWLNAASDASAAVVQLSIFFIGAVFAMRGSISVGMVMVFTNLCNFINMPIREMPEQWANRKAALTLIDKLAALLDENAEAEGENAPETLREGVALDNLSFAYEEGKPVLHDLSCRFEAGKSYAVVGASGSGKSTLLNLLLGAQRGYKGSLTLDGEELRGMSADSLYDLESLIGQNVFLFDDTIRNNITMFAPFPDADVARAIRLAGLEAVIAERGTDYRCGENGVNLSGGERQRIAIARSLLRGSSVLLVDEATSALDNETAQHVASAILDLDTLTRIVVTHRLDEALLRRYDGILMLKNGAVCEQGRFDELMAQKGQFYALYTVSNG
ncbi:MAG: ABC transporter ATP-binding protein [Ruminococcaceae bacterium]|jgi:ABC-type multidrug transport system fused ATPase/permease subunit|nr:ABC transporter ATP-binding protein [Oscillospiraceae bacterium]